MQTQPIVQGQVGQVGVQPIQSIGTLSPSTLSYTNSDDKIQHTMNILGRYIPGITPLSTFSNSVQEGMETRPTTYIYSEERTSEHPVDYEEEEEEEEEDENANPTMRPMTTRRPTTKPTTKMGTPRPTTKPTTKIGTPRPTPTSKVSGGTLTPTSNK
jgi:hypothetical protein